MPPVSRFRIQTLFSSARGEIEDVEVAGVELAHDLGEVEGGAEGLEELGVDAGLAELLFEKAGLVRRHLGNIELEITLGVGLSEDDRFKVCHRNSCLASDS